MTKEYFTNPRENDIHNMCVQILELSFDENYETGEKYCPICSESAYTNIFSDTKNHTTSCAVLIAKDLTTKPLL